MSETNLTEQEREVVELGRSDAGWGVHIGTALYLTQIIDRLDAELGRAKGVLAVIHEGLSGVRWPAYDGTREWQSDLGVYLRGNAYADLMLPPEQMTKLRHEARTAAEAANKGDER